MTVSTETPAASDFIRDIVAEDVCTGKYKRIHTRFPPTKEETEYVDSIMADVRWLIDGWADKNIGGAPLYASDYFDKLYEYAVDLVRKGKAYVDEMSPEQTDEYRRMGRESPFRNRSVEENLDLLGRMKAGEFADNTHTLRAKIDMTAPNVWLRDPVLYRIRHASHHRTGDKWSIYPMYDWAHIRSAPAALRMDSRRLRTAGATPASIRIRAA